MFDKTHFNYQGFEYQTWAEIDDDVIKTFHECWKDGCQIHMPREFYNTSPYDLVKYEDFCRYVDQVILEVFVNSKRKVDSLAV
jgi:hypothetical protein